ncbi:GTPase-activating protein CdGAPr isoform X2 [Toxorhynchites rutilus septentrionalis]|uniref:GTPase-activating protein CdGAPr isoform X2 n=1 Tax=Toxorhynchites rutilus septentrionalis TaxID=329112 RepID=UPI0024789E41|nr:GTPase-activating protein CdGAPr isoform X2 [Toxorhynchites rutilus septentrionalis]
MMSHSGKHIQSSSSATTASTASTGQESSSGLHSKMSDKSRTVSDSESEINYDLFNSSLASDCGASVMNTSQISNASNESTHIKSANLTRSQNLGGSCRFPKLEECAHFHYERVQLGKLSVRLVADEKNDSQLGQSGQSSLLTSTDLSCSQTSNAIIGGGGGGGKNNWFIIRITAGRSDSFMIKRSFENIRFLDEMLHRCVYDRRVSELENLKEMDVLEKGDDELEAIVAVYLNRLSVIASDAMTCGPVLTWLQIDNKGRRLPVADEQTMKSINTPAVGAAYGVRRYVAQACDEISIEVGDMISVIDMPSPAESVWWRGKKSHLQKNQYEVGFFPQSCVATIGDKVPRHMPFPAPLVGSLAVSPTKPVLRKHGKLIAFFRSFILSRPSRRRLKQSGIYKERVFSCDLGEHLLNSGQDIPMVLKCCAEFIEEYGIVDGIYRLSGITSNIQKLRRAFDEERIPDLTHPEIKQDIHAVSSLLKMYFRELPNPLCTYQLYDHFVEAIQTRSDAPNDLKLRLIRQTVQKLPPPHYRTLKYLATHLFKISRHSASTGMTERNIAIVWAPNLLRSPALESGGVAALRGVGVQAVVTEYLISNCEQIFDDNADDFGSHYVESQPTSLSDTNSIPNHSGLDQDLSLSMERPKSLSVGGAKLLSLEEARIRRNCMENCEKTVPINITNPSTHIGSYIEVGGGPSSLPDKYHTVLPVPSWNKRKSHSSWKSIFTRQPRQSNSNHDIKEYSNVTTPTSKEPPVIITNGRSLDEGSEQPEANVGLKESNSGLVQDKMTKSVDLFDGKSLTIESCARSNSVDSLRTTGHSRSVSHDSYFDLLQSPLRGGVVTCPSRELSELGLNFDREEPEMRIFSESESLVSSPKVPKESIRRTLRARPEEYTSGGNSVNPSPKKQPRLNIQNGAEGTKQQWMVASAETGSLNPDESLCKRYKLEDQLSDIQFIDCSTPEHNVSSAGSSLNSNTIFASVQVHRPPLQEDSDGENELIGVRNSYPGSQYSYVRYDSPIKETRFSYPGTSAKNREVSNAVNKEQQHQQEMNVDEHQQVQKNVSSLYESLILSSQASKPPKHPGRYSYNQASSNGGDQVTGDESRDEESQVVPRSCSENMLRKSDTQKSKLSVMTPQSPVQSPCYSLLVGSTSSDNSSNLNTPVYDMDVSVVLGQQQSLENTKEETEKQRDINTMKRELSLDLTEISAKNSSGSLLVIKKTSSPNTPSNFASDNTNTNTTTTTTSQSMTPSEFCYQNLNPELSPGELVTFAPKVASTKPTTPIKATINITYNLRSPVRKEQEGNIFGSSNNSCGSITPTTPKKLEEELKTIEDLREEEEYQRERRSIYENVLVTPVESQPPNEVSAAAKRLLETNFDETMVYEQVKFYKNAISEVNHLLGDGELAAHETFPKSMDRSNNGGDVKVPELESLEEQAKIKLKINEAEDGEEEDDEDEEDNTDGINNNQHRSRTGTDSSHSEVKEKADFILTSKSEEESDDVPMSDLNDDSLEFDNTDVSLYENVELRRKPFAPVYENMVPGPINVVCSTLKSTTDDDLSSLCVDRSDLDNEMEYRIEIPPKIEIKPPTNNVSVKQLATKFETSPVDVNPPFDFQQQSKINNNRGSSGPMVTIRNKSAKDYQSLTNITRSLDENAFVREFGSARKLESFNKSIQQIPEIDNILNENNPNRRKSLDFIRPKSLNPPKKLPSLSGQGIENLKDGNPTHDCCRQQQQQQKSSPPADLKLDLSTKIEDTKEARAYNVRITPTTENRISLVQYNYDNRSNRKEPQQQQCLQQQQQQQQQEEDRNSITSISSLKMLGSCKLDRSRIEKIKEERRHQLSEKYRSESFKGERGDYGKLKSKSKSELRDFKDTDGVDTGKKYDSLRFRSKSRIELTDQQQYSNLVDNSSLSSAVSLNTVASGQVGGGRTRRISDEKNQNDCIVVVSSSPPRLTTIGGGVGGGGSSNIPPDASITQVCDSKFELKTRQKFDKRGSSNSNSSSGDYPLSSGPVSIVGTGRERDSSYGSGGGTKSFVRNGVAQRDRFSPQISIKDVAAMFESRSQNQS